MSRGQGAAPAAANKQNTPSHDQVGGVGSPGGRASGRGTQQWEEHRMKKLLASAAALAALSAFAPTAAHADELTLCWAAWDPANALVELSKDFEKASGTTMKFEFVPWPNFADRMLNELNSGGKLCDLMIGDSQWIGRAAENR